MHPLWGLDSIGALQQEQDIRLCVSQHNSVIKTCSCCISSWIMPLLCFDLQRIGCTPATGFNACFLNMSFMEMTWGSHEEHLNMFLAVLNVIIKVMSSNRAASPLPCYDHHWACGSRVSGAVLPACPLPLASTGEATVVLQLHWSVALGERWSHGERKIKGLEKAEIARWGGGRMSCTSSCTSWDEAQAWVQRPRYNPRAMGSHVQGCVWSMTHLTGT